MEMGAHSHTHLWIPNLQPSLKFEPNSQGLEPNSQGLELNSQGLEPNSQGLEPNSQGLEPNSQGLEPIWERLMVLAQEVRERKRNHKSDMKAKLIELCSISALTSTDLSILTGKNRSYLRNEYLGTYGQRRCVKVSEDHTY